MAICGRAATKPLRRTAPPAARAGLGPAGQHLAPSFNDLNWLTFSKATTRFRGAQLAMANPRDAVSQDTDENPVKGSESA